MKNIATTAIAVLFALLVTCYLCVVVLPEGSTGVRLVMGHATDEQLVPGVHWELPHFYNIVQFGGSIHSDTYGENGNERACAGRMPGPFVLLWHVADARGFYPQSLAAPDKSVDEVGRPLVEGALCAEVSVKQLKRWDAVEAVALHNAINDRLAPDGLRLLAIQPKQN